MKTNKQARREAKQLFRMCLINERLDEARTREVARQLAASGYRDSRKVLGHFLHILQLDEARHTANVESATPLPPDLRATIQENLARRYGEGLTMVFTEEPALIGGVRMQVGSDVYDGSVRAGLAALEKRF